MYTHMCMYVCMYVYIYIYKLFTFVWQPFLVSGALKPEVPPRILERRETYKITSCST